jgi:hypothetical protein
MAFLFAKSFPFCIPPEKETKDIPVGSGTNYPIGMNLEDAMFLFWKNKTFSSFASFNASLDIPNFNGEGDSYVISGNLSQSGELGLASAIWPAKMTEMICPYVPGDYFPYFEGQASGTGVITSSYEDVEQIGSQIDLEFFDPLPNGYSVIIRDKKYYPKLNFVCYWAAAGASGISEIYIRSIKPSLARKTTDSLIVKASKKTYRADLFVTVYFQDLNIERIPDSASASFEISGLNDREAN